MKRFLGLSAALAMSVLGFLLASRSLVAQEGEDGCIACHREATPFIVADWEASRHAQSKALRATCDKCHGTRHDKASNRDQASMPTANTCRRCHLKQFRQYEKGKHALAWKAMEAIPLTHGLPEEITQGMKGCGGCHKVGIVKAEDHAPYRFSGGSGCAACHGKHRFELESMKDPEICAKCHIGFDHPQWEMWKHSSHGIAYKTGSDKRRAPTCQRCHVPDGDHENITAWSFLAVRVPETDEAWWTDRLEILKALGVLDAEGKKTALYALVDKLKLARTSKEDFDRLREKQIGICRECHGESMVRERFGIYDGVLREADRVLAEAIRIVAGLYRDGLIEPREGAPVKGYPFVLDFYEVDTAVEQELYLMYEEYRMRTYQGAFHENWDYMHWEGWGMMRKSLVKIRDMAKAMRSRAK